MKLIIQRHSLSAEQEALLQFPDRTLGPLLKLPTLQGIEKAIGPLITAATALKEAVKLKTPSEHSLTASQWKSIMGIAAVATQRTRLLQISESFCDRLGEWAMNLFDWLLKHKSIAEAIVPKLFTTNRVSTIAAFSRSHCLALIALCSVDMCRRNLLSACGRLHGEPQRLHQVSSAAEQIPQS